MKVQFDKVEEVIEDEIKTSDKATSAYVYLPKKHAGKKAKVCIMKNDNRNCTDIMLEEVYTMLSGLSRLLLDKKIKDLSKRKRNER